MNDSAGLGVCVCVCVCVCAAVGFCGEMGNMAQETGPCSQLGCWQGYSAEHFAYQSQMNSEGRVVLESARIMKSSAYGGMHTKTFGNIMLFYTSFATRAKDCPCCSTLLCTNVSYLHSVFEVTTEAI